MMALHVQTYLFTNTEVKACIVKW